MRITLKARGVFLVKFHCFLFRWAFGDSGFECQFYVATCLNFIVVMVLVFLVIHDYTKFHWSESFSRRSVWATQACREWCPEPTKRRRTRVHISGQVAWSSNFAWWWVDVERFYSHNKSKICCFGFSMFPFAPDIRRCEMILTGF